MQFEDVDAELEVLFIHPGRTGGERRRELPRRLLRPPASNPVRKFFRKPVLPALKVRVGS
jgi:hypothetical protein